MRFVSQKMISKSISQMTKAYWSNWKPLIVLNVFVSEIKIQINLLSNYMMVSFFYSALQNAKTLGIYQWTLFFSPTCVGTSCTTMLNLTTYQKTTSLTYIVLFVSVKLNIRYMTSLVVQVNDKLWLCSIYMNYTNDGWKCILNRYLNNVDRTGYTTQLLHWYDVPGSSYPLDKFAYIIDRPGNMCSSFTWTTCR